MIGKLHKAGIMHGDLTTSNLILRKSDGKCVLIDFGLAQATTEIEQRGVDIHVLFQTLESTAPTMQMYSRQHSLQDIQKRLMVLLM